VISRVCEEFDIDPVRALWVMDHAPAGMIADILELRAYAATWQALGQAGDAKGRNRIYATPAGQRVAEIEAELARARRAARDAGDGE
jgi:hypothetical protein